MHSISGFVMQRAPRTVCWGWNARTNSAKIICSRYFINNTTSLYISINGGRRREGDNTEGGGADEEEDDHHGSGNFGEPSPPNKDLVAGPLNSLNHTTVLPGA